MTIKLTFGSFDFPQNEHELKIEEIFLPWKAKHTGKIVAP